MECSWVLSKLLKRINPCDKASGKVGDLIYDYLIKPVGYGTKCHCCKQLRFFALGIVLTLITQKLFS